MTKPSEISTAVLVGGQSRRMGGYPKGLIKVEGQTIIHRLAKAGCDGPFFLVGNPDGPYGGLGYPIVDDRMSHRGAPGGVLTALHYSTTPWTRILSCDLPYVCGATLSQLKPSPDTDVVGFKVKDKRQYLVSLWNQRARDVLDTCLQEGNPGFADILTQLRSVWVEVDRPMDVTNLNHLADLEDHGLSL